MKCLSLWQPWAYTMLYGPKDLENRGWPTSHRGSLLVHASKTVTDLNGATFDRIRVLWPEVPPLLMSMCPLGAIVGIVDVVGCGRPENFPGNGWAWGPWCHQWANRRPFKTPIPYRGAQGLFDVPEAIVREAIRQVDQ